MIEEKGRIGYFDLMKGVCIILVVIGHCYDKLGVRIDNHHVWSALEHLRMPLYFFLSGMFFKEYSCAIEFVIKKFNRLIAPFLFFAVISVVPALFSGEVECSVLGIKHHITWMVKYAGYLWFLRTLFVANLVYYIYYKVVKRCKWGVQCAVMCVIVCIGWMLNELLPQDNAIRSDYGILYSVITSMIVMPFLYVASNFRNVLSKIENIKKIHVLMIFAMSVVVCYLTANGGVYLMYAKVENSPIGFYLASFSAILMVWSVCYTLRNYLSRGYLNYMGRYSIIVYLTHVPLLGALVFSGMITKLWLLILVLFVVMPIMITLFKSCFPAFVAQRDIFICEKGKIKVDFGAFSLKNR